MTLPKFSVLSIDWSIIIPVLVLILLSLTTLFSVDIALFRTQLVFAILSLVVFVIFSQLNPQAIKNFSVPIYLVSIFLLLLVLILGKESRGSVRWIELFGLRAQFSEILKPFLAISLASYLSTIEKFSFKYFIKVLMLLFPIFILIFLQPDLGNSLIYGGTVIFVLLIFGFPIQFFLSGIIGLAGAFPALWLILHDYQKARLLTFIDPARDPLGTSYNAIQAVIAVGSGMILGKGLGQGTQSHLRFLPENHTDFIFATISEQVGFIGSVILIITFIFLLYRIYLLFKNSEDRFSRNFCLIVFSFLFIHFFLNVGMNLGIVPVVGITLPFVSYGGSSLLSNFIMLAFLFALSKRKRDDVLEIGS